MNEMSDAYIETKRMYLVGVDKPINIAHHSYMNE